MKGLTILLIICSLFCFMLSAYKIFMVYSHPVKYLNNIEVYAKEFELPPSLIASVINTESGFIEDAKRIAKKYVDLVDTNFEKTGGLWEKYNAVTGGIDAVSEYGTPEMMGWTAGVYLYCKKFLNQ